MIDLISFVNQDLQVTKYKFVLKKTLDIYTFEQFFNNT